VKLKIVVCVLLAAAGQAKAQDQTKLGAEFAGEAGRFKASCLSFSLSSLPGCGELLFLDHPLHVAVGSIAPQNGFGAGMAFVAHYTPNDDWRLSWNADAVASNNGSWRAGIYMTAVITTPRKETTTKGRPDPNHKPRPSSLERPEFHVYAQTISLNKIDYFGLGPSTTLAGRSFFGMRETIPGANVWWPIFEPLHISLYGEFNGRFVDLRPSTGQPSPSIEQLYTNATAPGLSSQPGFAQLGEGVRLRPAIPKTNLRLNYLLGFQEFFAPSNSQFSFQRFNADLRHEFVLYKGTRTFYSVPGNGPDECTAAESDTSTMTQAEVAREKKQRQGHPCPPVSRSREGSLGFRFLLSQSFTQQQHVVPFYFQPTLGGSDINGNPALPSYQDYRFRAPKTMLLRESFDHSIYGPLGFAFMADQGKVSSAQGDLGSSPWIHSFAAGLTLRAGGFPQVYLLFAWGGNEGTHTIASVNTSLLGGSMRPSLY
jgi:hypothetical protein